MKNILQTICAATTAIMLLANPITANINNPRQTQAENHTRDENPIPLYLIGFSIQQNKTYDGNTTINIINYGTLNTQADGQGTTPDDVELDYSNASANTASPNAGTNLEVTISSLELTGSENYNLVPPTGLTTNILPRTVVHNGLMTIHDKAYDGTTVAEIDDWGAIEQSDIIDGDDVSLLQDANVTTAHFEDANVGENKTVYVYNLALTGTHAGNYRFSSPPLPPGHGGGDDYSPPDLYSSASITQAGFSQIHIIGPENITAGQTSSNFTLYAKDIFGNNVEVDEEITITLASNSGSTDEAISFEPPTITLQQGAVSATFTYMDQKAGTHTITATASLAGSKRNVPAKQTPGKLQDASMMLNSSSM